MPLPTLNFTNKDFESIKEDLLSKVPVLAPAWTNLNEGEFAMALLNMVSMCADMLAYSLDRSVEEVYLPTARLRESLKKIVNLIDYRLHRPIAAATTIRFSLTSALSTNLVIPQYTVVRTAGNVYFVTKEEVTIFAGKTEIETPAYQGELITDSFTGTGTEEQSFKLTRSNVAQNFLDVRVNGDLWTEDHRALADYNDGGVYVVDTDSVEGSTIRFTRFLGNTPGQNATVEATYIETLGEAGNIGSGLVTTLVTTFTNSELLSVTNIDPASGGEDRETTESARARAPRSLRYQNRAVTLQDFVDIVESVSGILQAQAINHAGYVEMYVRPEDVDSLYLPAPVPVAAGTYVDGSSTLAPGTYYVGLTAFDGTGETATWEYDPADRSVLDYIQNVVVASGEAIFVTLPVDRTGIEYFGVYVGTDLNDMRRASKIVADAGDPGVNALPSVSAAKMPTVNTTGPRNADGSKSLRQVIEDTLELRRAIGCVFALFNPSFQSVDVTATVKIHDNFYQADVKGRVETAISQYFAAENQEFGQDVTVSDLYEVTMDVPGVRSVRFTLPADDVEIPNGTLARQGTVTLTMEGGIS